MLPYHLSGQCSVPYHLSGQCSVPWRNTHVVYGDILVTQMSHQQRKRALLGPARGYDDYSLSHLSQLPKPFVS